MKKIFMFWLIIPLILLLWCDNLCNKTEREITETFWSRTCAWKWVDKIEWYATCKTTDWWSYFWDVRWHDFNWKWKLITSNWETQDGYFYNWSFIAGKVSFSNGDATKWLRTIIDNWTSMLEFWKNFSKKTWKIMIWDFDNWYLTYWMSSENWKTMAGEFRQWGLYNWYISVNNWCAMASNWNLREITRTITNTVYRNNGIQLSNPLGDLYKLWGKYNPYTVQLELK